MVYTSFNKGFMIETKQEEDIFNNIPDINTDNISDNLDEAVSNLICETEVNWNNLMQAVGIAELTAMENTGEVIYEAVDIKAFFQKICDFFKNIFDKIAALFKKLALKVDEWFTSKSVKMFVNSEKFKNTTTVPKGFKYTGYTFTTSYNYLSDSGSSVDCVMSTSLFKNSRVWGDFSAEGKSVFYNKELINNRKRWISKANEVDTKQQTIKEMRCYIINSDPSFEKEDDWQKLLFKIFRNGQSEPSEILEKDIDLSSYKKMLQNGYGDIKKKISEALKQAKSNADECINEFNKMLKNAEKDYGRKSFFRYSIYRTTQEGDSFYDIIASMINITTFYFKTYIQDVTSLSVAHIRALLDETKQYKAAITKMIEMSSSAETSTSKTESTINMNDSNLSGISEYTYSLLDNVNFI